MNAPARKRLGIGGRLFVRIYATFVVSVLLFTVLAAGLVGLWFSSWDQDRVDAIVERVEEDSDALTAALREFDMKRGLELTRALSDELDADVVLLPKPSNEARPPMRGKRGRRGKRGKQAHEEQLHLAGQTEEERALHLHLAENLSHRRQDTKRLRKGLPVIHRKGPAPPVISVPLLEDNPTGGQRLAGVIAVVPRRNPRGGLLIGAILLFVALGAGAWILAHSLTSRLAKLERSTDILAGGDLSHRAALDREEPRDEVDRLALSFNQMAERLDSLVTGQRTLLANVSHELRTPIARIRVLIEILGERLEGMSEAQQSGQLADASAIARLERGLGEMQEDIDEVEALIRDLLTSGRLELGGDGAIERTPIELGDLCQRAATRFDASVEGLDAGPVEIAGDPMLLDRLLKNLLSNARRACPDGALTLRVSTEDARARVEVEDEGPGIPVDKRQQIFEPFTRLDSARARDQGGVGLGLYLCRQIAQAHGATITAQDRRDGAPGARFLISW